MITFIVFYPLGDSDLRRMSAAKRHFEKTDTIFKSSGFIKHFNEFSDSPKERRDLARARL